MPRLFESPAWSLELPDSWEAVSRADYVEIRVPFAGAQLRVTSYRDETGRSSAADWLEATAHFNRTRGRRVIPRQCGDFAGHETPFDAERVWIRGWALVADDQGLDVDYRCATTDAGRDDSAVDAVLSTLRLRRAAT
jgi:hypothetical protein